MYNHFKYYSLSWLKNPLTKAPDLVNNDQALAKYSVRDCSLYNKVTQARHYLEFVLFLCLKYSLKLYGGLCGGRKSAIPLYSTATHTVCHPYCSRGSRFHLLYKGGYDA